MFLHPPGWWFGHPCTKLQPLSLPLGNAETSVRPFDIDKLPSEKNGWLPLNCKSLRKSKWSFSLQADNQPDNRDQESASLLVVFDVPTTGNADFILPDVQILFMCFAAHECSSTTEVPLTHLERSEQSLWLDKNAETCTFGYLLGFLIIAFDGE